MPDQRETQLKHWVESAFASMLPGADVSSEIHTSWQRIAGDASLRRYFRIQVKQRSYVLMDSPACAGDVEIFVKLGQCLRNANVHAPLVYASNIENGFLVLEDFGVKMFMHLLNVETGQQLFDRVVPVLEKLVRCDARGLPDYSFAKLQQELDLFPQWYVAPRCNQSDEQLVGHGEWKQFCDVLVKTVLMQPSTFVHRDFHSCNLHLLDNGDTGVIDYQDALSGPVSYDLVSWLWDRYVAWPREDIEYWMEQARQRFAVDIDKQEWVRYCDFMGLQRNLKIIGVFARLGLRDKRESYIALIPQFTQYVRDVLPLYSELKPFSSLIDEWLQ